MPVTKKPPTQKKAPKPTLAARATKTPPKPVPAKPRREKKAKDLELILDEVLLHGQAGRVRLTGNEDFQLLCLIMLRLLTYGRRVWPHEYTDRTDPGVCKHCKMVDDALEIMKQRLVRFE